MLHKVFYMKESLVIDVHLHILVDPCISFYYTHRGQFCKCYKSSFVEKILLL